MFDQLQNWIDDLKRKQSLFEELCRELKISARSRIAGERSILTLDVTSLVHEARMRLEKRLDTPWRDRSQYFEVASEAMTRILVEGARRIDPIKRGSGQMAVPMDGIDLPDDTDHQRLLEVSNVLGILEREDRIKAQIVKMRFYCGMENEEIAVILGFYENTIRCHWQLAKVRRFSAIQEICE